MTDDNYLRARIATQSQTITGLNELLADMREVNRMMNDRIVMLRAATVALRRFCHSEGCSCRGCADVEFLLASTEGTR